MKEFDFIYDIDNMDTSSLDVSHIWTNGGGSSGCISTSTILGNGNVTYSINTNWGASSTVITDANGDVNLDGDIKVKGRSIIDSLDKIEKRLAILNPDPKKLEHFDALQKAYEHYKVLEALCELPVDKDENS